MGTIIHGPLHPATLSLMRKNHPELWLMPTVEEWNQAWAQFTSTEMRTLIEDSTVDSEDHDYQGDGTSRCPVCLGQMNDHISWAKP
jgi:hypothetical protein